MLTAGRLIQFVGAVFNCRASCGWWQAGRNAGAAKYVRRRAGSRTTPSSKTAGAVRWGDERARARARAGEEERRE